MTNKLIVKMVKLNICKKLSYIKVCIFFFRNKLPPDLLRRAWLPFSKLENQKLIRETWINQNNKERFCKNKNRTNTIS